MDQVIKNCWAEVFYVLDDENDWPIHRYAFLLKDLLHSKERLLAQRLVVLIHVLCIIIRVKLIQILVLRLACLGFASFSPLSVYSSGLDFTLVIFDDTLSEMIGNLLQHSIWFVSFDLLLVWLRHI